MPPKKTDQPKPPTLKQAKTACLQIHSLIVRHRAHHLCQAVGVIPGGCEGPLQCAHIIPKRRNTHVNLEVGNGWCLCSKHHILVDQNPAQWLRMVMSRSQGVDVALALQRLQEQRKGEAMSVSEGGISAMMRYRTELVDLIGFAQVTDVPLAPVPKHILRWVEAQSASQEEARSL